jgi:hypothetical protein
VSEVLWLSRNFTQSIVLRGTKSAFEEIARYLSDSTGDFLAASEHGDVKVTIQLSELIKHVRISFDPDGRHLTVSASSVGRNFLSSELLDLSSVPAPYHWHAEWYDSHPYFEETSLDTVFELINE